MGGEIFISYRHADLAKAQLLCDRLKHHGVEAWYDTRVGAGEDWRATTARALTHARIFVLLYSKAASESDDIAKELAAATFSKKLVVPIRLENIQPEGAFLYELASRNWINAFEDTDAQLAEIAKNLAELVKSGGPDASDHPSEHEPPPPAKTKTARWATIAIGAVVVLVAATAVGWGMLASPKPKPVSARIAFFGFDAPAGDKDAQATAAAASSDMLITFGALQRDVAASADTQSVPPQERLARAAKLNAVYAISGAVTRLGDELRVDWRVEDAPSHTELWPDAIQGKASKPESLANRVAAALNDRLTCVISARAGLAVDDPKVVARLPKACESLRGAQPGNADRWQELAQLAPNSAWVQGNVASVLFEAIADAQPADAESMHQRAEVALKRAEAIDPNMWTVGMARIDQAIVRRAPLAEIEDVRVDALNRARRSADLNGTYADSLIRHGLVEKAIPYGNDALTLDPLSYNKMLGVAAGLAREGKTAEAERKFQQRHTLFPDPGEWILHVIAALFDGVGDVDAVLADQPENVSAPTALCVRDIARLARKHTAAADKAADKLVSGCADSLFPTAVDQFHVFLGDYDDIFDPKADIDRFNIFMFDRNLAKLRADPRFEQLAQRTGLLDYWRTGRTPDFCEAEKKAPVCEAIAAK